MRCTLRNARKLFDETTARGHFLRSQLCCLYHSKLHTACAYPEDSVDILSENKNVVSWSSKVSSLLKQNRPRDAIHCFKSILFNEERPNYVTILSAVRASGALASKNLTRAFHGLVIKMGFQIEVPPLTALIAVYGDYDLSAVWKLFEDMPLKDLIVWSAMISVCVKHSEYERSFNLFKDMLRTGVEPNYVSILSILSASAKHGALSFGKQVHGFCARSTYHSFTDVQNALIHMYASCRDFNSAIQVFSEVRKKDLVTWKTFIYGCIENEYPRRALEAFCKMQASCFELEESVLCNVIGAASEAQELIMGLTLHCYSLKSGFVVFVSVGTSLLQMYAKSGHLDMSENLFDQLFQKDLMAWTTMISAYAQSGQPSNALDTFRQMKLANVYPNEFTFVCLIQACSLMSAQELGESIHGFVLKSGHLPNPFLVSALIDMYFKLGNTSQGKALFAESSIKDLICWSSLINGYGLNGRGIEALETFSNMLGCGLLPNEVVFISVLSACAHCGLEHEGWHWFYSMQEEYGITPKLAHYACMVDLLSRQRNVKEALDFVYKMPIEPDQRIWGSLLAGCRNNDGFGEIAEVAAEKLVELDQENMSYFVFLSNLYAEKGRWQDVERLRTLVDEKGLKKMTGYSMIGSS